MYKDIDVVCKCGNSFTYTAADQRFYEERGYNAPKRCHPCREEKKRFFDEKEKRGLNGENATGGSGQY